MFKIFTSCVMLSAFYAACSHGKNAVWAEPPATKDQATSKEQPGANEQTGTKEQRGAKDGPAGKEQGADEAKRELLVDDGKSLFILSDRKEKITEFFQRNRVVIGDLWQKDLNKLSQAKEPIGKLFLSYTSANDDPAKDNTFGDTLTLAPLPPEVAALIDKHAEPKGADGDRLVTVLLRRDAKQTGLYHIVGVTTQNPVGFFALKEKLKGNDFAPADLTYKTK